jgi:predicted SAM-dependent methyltransferase
MQIKEILLFGAGSGGILAYNNLPNNYSCIGFIDNDSAKQGKEIVGKPIIAPKQLSQYRFDAIILSSIFSADIRNQLLALGVEESKIKSSDVFINPIMPQKDHSSELRLDFGCGSIQPKHGYVGVDIRPLPGIRYICNAWEICDLVAAESVLSIYSRHFFEHLTFAQAHLTLCAWMTILRPGGTIQMIIPDLAYHIAQFLAPNRKAPSEANPNWTLQQHAIGSFWGWQCDGATETWDVHKSGYDFDLLDESLQKHGFRNVRRVYDNPWNLNVICQKENPFTP